MYFSPRIVTSGLIFVVDAADKNSYPGTGTTWKDLSGNNYTGTLTNGPTFNSAFYSESSQMCVIVHFSFCKVPS